MRLLFDRSIYPEPDWSCPADESEAAVQALGRRQKRIVKDDDDAQKQPVKDEDEDDILPGDFETEQDYHDALEDAGIDIDDAAPWDEAQA